MSTDVAAAQAQSKIDLTKKKNEEIKRKEKWCYQALLAEPERLVSL